MNFTRHARGFHSTFLEIERTLPKKAPSEATVFFAGSISLSLSRALSLSLSYFFAEPKSEITPTQARTSPGDGSMGTTDPGYVGVGMGPGARLGFVRMLLKKIKKIGSFFAVHASQPAASSQPPCDSSPQNSVFCE